MGIWSRFRGVADFSACDFFVHRRGEAVTHPRRADLEGLADHEGGLLGLRLVARVYDRERLVGGMAAAEHPVEADAVVDLVRHLPASAAQFDDRQAQQARVDAL